MPKSRFAQDAAAMGHTIQQHAAHIFQDGGNLADQYIPEFQRTVQPDDPTLGPLAGGVPTQQQQQRFNSPLDPSNPATYTPQFDPRVDPQAPTQGPLVGGQRSVPQRPEFTPETTAIDATRIETDDDFLDFAKVVSDVKGSDFRSNKAYKDYDYFKDDNGILMFKSSPDAEPKRVTSKVALKEYDGYMNEKIAFQIVKDVPTELKEVLKPVDVEKMVEGEMNPVPSAVTEAEQKQAVEAESRSNIGALRLPAAVRGYPRYMAHAAAVGHGIQSENSARPITEKFITRKEKMTYRDVIARNLLSGKGGSLDYRDYSADELINQAASSDAALQEIKGRGMKEILMNTELSLSQFTGNVQAYRNEKGEVIISDDYDFNPSQNKAGLKEGATVGEIRDIYKNSGYIQSQKSESFKEDVGEEGGMWNRLHSLGEQVKTTIPLEINIGKGKRFLTKEQIAALPLLPTDGMHHKPNQNELAQVQAQPQPQASTETLGCGGKLARHQDGGELTSAQMDSTFNANRNVPFVDRIYNPDPNLQMPIPGGSQSHLMGSYGDYVAPRVVMNQDSTMREVPQNQVGDQVIGAGNAIQMSSAEKAKFFAENYKNTKAWKGYQKGMEKKANGGKLPKYQWGGETFGKDQFARTLNTGQLAGRHEDLENLKYLDLPDTDWGALAMNVGGAALSAYGGAGGDFGGALGSISSADISGLGSSLMGASSGSLAGANVVGGQYGGFDMAAMGGLGIGQYMQQQQGGRFGQSDGGQAAANAATDATLNQMGQSQLAQAQQLQSQRAGSGQPSGQPLGGIPGALQAQQGQPNNAFSSPIYAPQSGPRALQDGGELGGRELPRHQEGSVEPITMTQENYDGLIGDLSQEQQEGFVPVYQDGGQLMGYLPEHSFGSWLGDNAGKILKTAGGIISVIPPIGTVVGPILIGAGYATDAIVGAVRKNRAEDELVEAQSREEAAAQKRESSAALAAQFDPAENIDYGATFETYQFGGGLMDQGQGNAMNPMIVDYNNGQSHSGPQGGIPVDAKGNPVGISKQSAVGLTEMGEVAWNGYIFSDNDDLTA